MEASSRRVPLHSAATPPLITPYNGPIFNQSLIQAAPTLPDLQNRTWPRPGGLHINTRAQQLCRGHVSFCVYGLIFLVVVIVLMPVCALCNYAKQGAMQIKNSHYYYYHHTSDLHFFFVLVFCCCHRRPSLFPFTQPAPFLLFISKAVRRWVVGWVGWVGAGPKEAEPLHKKP